MELIKNPLNYTGSKDRIMPLLLQHKPENCSVIVDLFGGSGTVGVNLSNDGNTVFYNERNPYIYNLIDFISSVDINILLHDINKVIQENNLSKTNKESFIEFRSIFNRLHAVNLINCSDKKLHYIACLNLLVMSFYSFNHQITFTKDGRFSVPSGYNRSSYNKNIENKIINFKNKIDKINFIKSCCDFREFMDYFKLTEIDCKNVLFFCDPPYLLSNSVYDRTCNYRWTEEEEKDLYVLCKEIDKMGGKFILTNMLRSKGKTNEHLLTFSKHYDTISTNTNFDFCSYQRKNKKVDLEILVKNY